MKEASHGKILAQNYWEPDYIEDNKLESRQEKGQNGVLEGAWKAE
jgi:hypothetical protein